jgi:hypothetical protein
MGLPPEALCKRDSADQESWSNTEELLAQLIEEVSVMTAGHQRKEPRKVPRPYGETERARPPKPGLVESDGRVRAVGAAAIVTHAAARGQVGPRE